MNREQIINEVMQSFKNQLMEADDELLEALKENRIVIHLQEATTNESGGALNWQG